MLLLPDGTVMTANPGTSSSWYRLTPDIHGSYANGTWTTLASMHDTRLYYSSEVLRDGRVFVAGGEYGTGGKNAEVYNPGTDTWTPTFPSGQNFVDSISKLIPNGNVLVAPVYPTPSGYTAIYNPTSNMWVTGPKLYRGSNQDEASWVKLPDDSILTVDPFGTNSERYIPASNTWVNDGVVPVALYDSSLYETGPAFMLPDGRAFFLGGTGHTAFYTPSGSTSPGVWAAGPDMPVLAGIQQGNPDAAAAMLVTGNILCSMAQAGTYNQPTSFYEFDPVGGNFYRGERPNRGD